MKTAVVGASGYAGSELLRLIASHDGLELVVATGDTAAGKRIAEHLPHLAAAYGTWTLQETASVLASDAELVFLALPHGASQDLVPRLVAEGRRVVDLGADFRLRDPLEYERWYGHEHQAPALLSRAVYGLVERHRAELVDATLVAAPGCYPTATALALGPFLDAELINAQGIIVNALSGTSGAGRTLSERLHFSRMHGNAEAYGLLHHRHTGEMQQELGAELLFTPHLVPVSRGMLVTAYARTSLRSTEAALERLHQVYDAEPFVVVVDEPPTLKDPVGGNLAFVSARVDERTGWIVAMSSLDNLVKGAAGQAVQAANVACRFPETMGLSNVGINP